MRGQACVVPMCACGVTVDTERVIVTKMIDYCRNLLRFFVIADQRGFDSTVNRLEICIFEVWRKDLF